MDKQIGCRILRASNDELEVQFSDDLAKFLEENELLDLFDKQDHWIVESPLGTDIPNTHTYDSDKRVATIRLERQLIRGEWVRFRIIRDRIWPLEDKTLAQDTARVGLNEGGGEKDLEPKLDEAIKAVQDLSSYPFPVTDATPTQPASGSTSGPASLTRLVDGAMKTALGRLPKLDDTRSFVGALNQAFKLSQTEGHTVVEWTPHALSGTTDLGGGVTGAQASLAAFGQNALKATLPLIDGLYSLLPDPDPQEVTAARSNLRTPWIEGVEEFATEGGPRAPRVNQLFTQIWMQHLPYLGQQLGMVVVENGKPKPGDGVPFIISREHVITPDEEENLTNFIAVKDYVYSVILSWENYLKSRTQNEDLGTGLVLLARALSVVAEQVAEVYASMDSVYIGPAERLVIPVTFSNNRTMMVEELMSWIDTFASEEAPSLIQEGGLRGVQAIQPIVEELEDLIGEFVDQIEAPNSGLPDGLRQRRVKNPLKELEKYLSDVETQIKRLAPKPDVALKEKDSLEKLRHDLTQLQERIKNPGR
jgi:hypothetical protein